MNDKHTEIFASAPIPVAVAKNAIPAMISMLVTLIYNLADTFFVGQTNDALQVAAVSASTPIFMLLTGFGMIFGIGGTSMISRALGRGEMDYAKRVCSFCFWSAVGLGVIMMVIYLLGMDIMVGLIGTSEASSVYAREYLVWIAVSAPFVLISNVFSNTIRAEGKATVAMGGMMIGTVVNIVLDPVMILWMDMGVAGAAIATMIGNICSAAFYIFYFLGGKSRLTISPKYFAAGNKIATGVLSIGIPAGLNSLMMTVANVVMNNVMAGYGDVQLAAMGVAMKVCSMLVMLQIGMGQGIQPILGYNFGADNMSRFKATIRFSLICSVILGCILTVLCYVGSGPIVRAFIDDAEVYSYGVQFVRAVMVSGPVIGIMFVMNNALQAMGAALPSLILSIARQGFVYIPVLLILNAIFGIDGAAYTQPVTDVFAILLACTAYMLVLRKHERRIAKKA